MQVQNVEFERFARIIKEEDRRIIVWGIGTFFRTCMPYLLNEYHLNDFVGSLVDGDEKKWNKSLIVNGKKYVIQSPERMLGQQMAGKPNQHVLLITSSYFAGILDFMDAMGNGAHMKCFIAPFMFQGHCENNFQKYKSRTQQIPKVIHYCWFGKKEMPKKSRRCIGSWRKYCPDYEIKEWNESNYDLKKNKYMYQAYQAGRYGYVPDYARIDLLYHYGGVYFDTDVELIRNIDELLYLRGFTSFEEYPMVNFGGGSGSIRGLGILKEILDYRDKMDFINPEGELNLLTCGFYETAPLLENGLRIANTVQDIKGLTVLTSDYFHVKSSITKEINIKENTFGIHDFSWSWVTEKQKEEQNRTSGLVHQYFAT